RRSRRQISTHSPRVGRTMDMETVVGTFTDFNSLAPCGANLVGVVPLMKLSTISTHSPRVGRTGGADGGKRYLVHFNSLAPCGANRRPLPSTWQGRQFQLTRPVWGEPTASSGFTMMFWISTHSPRVGRTGED